MKKAGWEKDRKINILLLKMEYEHIGLDMPTNVEKFLTQYGMLSFYDSDRHEDVNFNPLKAIGKNLDAQYFEELLVEYEIDTIVYPIGTACRDNLLLIMTESEIFYCFTDGYLEECGKNVDEMLDCLVGECKEARIIE